MPTGSSNNGIQRTEQQTKASVTTEREHSMPDLILTTFDWVQIDVIDIAAVHLWVLTADARGIQPRAVFLCQG